MSIPEPDTQWQRVLGDTTLDLDNLIVRLNAGDDSAVRPLLERALGRLHRLAAAMFHRRFPDLEDRHDVESVVSHVWLKLLKALETARPATAQELFGLMALNIRRVLLDMVDTQRQNDARRAGADNTGLEASNGAAGEWSDSTFEPSRLALWTEFHRTVETLPADERSVVDMHFYGDVPQSEIARILSLSPRKVSYLWVAATERVSEQLTGLDGLLAP
jgi:RNA polymerase sigma factor (sigma-70 family)